jgi:hypothetical protein
MNRFCAAVISTCVVGWLLASVLVVEAEEIKLRVSVGKFDHVNVPVRVAVPNGAKAGDRAAITDSKGNTITGQVTGPSLLGKDQPELHFVLPKLQAGETIELTAKVAPSDDSAGGFTWTHSEGKYAELSFANRPVLRYMHEGLDESSKERRMETYKVYHHVYDPQGKQFVTKGAGGLFPHHRGLFYGFNRISYGDGKKADIWHCNKGESQSHEEFLISESGPVLGRHRLAIDWRGQDGKAFAKEQRELTAYNTPGGVLIEFASRLKSVVGDINLDGDPQHAGFQFRGSQHIPDKTKHLTYYLRPDGKDKPGSFRNWPANKEHVNLPWNAQSFVIDEQRYTCGYLDRPHNPKESRFSERDYGRFGSYFEYQLAEDKPLDLNYRVWLQEGEMTVEQVAAHSNSFVTPPQVAIE